MSEPIIADFVGKFNAGVMARPEPVPGRVLLSKQRLVLAARADEKLTISLDSIIDVAVGHVPPDLGDFFDSTVTIAYERDGKGRVAAIEGNDDNITKFSNVLFKALLNGAEATVKERATVGGLVTDEEFTHAAVSLTPEGVEFTRDGGSFQIDVETVVDYEVTADDVSGTRRSVIGVRHREDGRTVRTLVAISTPRKLSLLGRYLRLEFSEFVRDIADIDLEETSQRLLVAVYSTGESAERTLSRILECNRSEVADRLQELENEGLLAERDEAYVPTRMGEVVVLQHTREIEG